MKSEYEQILNDLNEDDESEEYRKKIEENLIYIGTFGLDDPVRDGVRTSIEEIMLGKANLEKDNDDDFVKVMQQEVNIRMLSGDHIETCRRVAIETGIINENEAYDAGVVISAKEFND